MAEYSSDRKKFDLINVAGFVFGLVGLGLTILSATKYAEEWREYALISSGWVAVILFLPFLIRAGISSEKNNREIGELTGKVENLEKRLNDSLVVSSYLATLHQAPSATPRAVTANPPSHEQ